MPQVDVHQAHSAFASDEAAQIYEEQLLAFRRDGASSEVDFRNLVGGVSATERATHGMHAYPAKLLRHIPALFASIPRLSKPGDVVGDPFCGSGTVLVEAIIAGRKAVGVDTNPLARLLATVKTNQIPTAEVRAAIEEVVRAAQPRHVLPPDVPQRVSYWFHPHVVEELSGLRMAIDAVDDGPIKRFLQLTLSATARKVSLADPRVAVPVRLRPSRYHPSHRLYRAAVERTRQLAVVDVVQSFHRNADANIARLSNLPHGAEATVLAGDARRLQVLDHRRYAFDCVITSPPYLGAQKYVRASSLGLMWLGYTPTGALQPLAQDSIGREHFREDELAFERTTGLDDADELLHSVRQANPLRAHLAATYLIEMRSAMSGIKGLLKPSGAFVLVAGPNRLCGREFPTPRYLTLLAEECGFRVECSMIDTIRSRGLMTRRNRSAGTIASETVTVLTKPVPERTRLTPYSSRSGCLTNVYGRGEPPGR
jgi:hypothetical protein